MRRVLALWSLGLVACAALAASAAAPVQGTDPYAPFLQDLPWRNVGPAACGGRIDDFAVVDSNPATYYVATASSGLLKTTNHGTTWDPVFDEQPVSSIGAVAVSQSNPDIVWVGTGEPNNRQSSSWGNGVYKSTDAGETWEHMGLEETHHVGRVLIHPTNPEIVYIAAVGRLWGSNEERGMFKTTNGGRTWRKTLYLDEETGAIDAQIDLQNPDILYAAMYRRQRATWGFASGGSQGGIFKSTDGGETWRKLTEGLPTDNVGRIGLNIFRRDPRIVYAVYEAGGQNNSGVYRSEDHGETWQRLSTTNPRPMYFSKIRVDPNDDQLVWVLGVQLYRSTNGGRTFSTAFARNVHVDHHAMWINPADSNHLILGSDGGNHRSWDGGRTWEHLSNLPLAQYYEITYDFQKPYWIYGGLQDNGTWVGPSATYNSRGASTEEYWHTILGGDGFYARVDPTDHNTVYAESQNGNVRRIDMRTRQSTSIRPNVQGETVRFNWNTPIEISPHHPRKLLVGGHRLFISTNRGNSWRHTEDLTTGVDRSTLPIMGAPPQRGQTLSMNDGVTHFPTLTTVAESPLQEGILWVGSDDGNVQVSRDDGETWTHVSENVPDVPSGSYVSRVLPSAHVLSRCYLTFDAHRTNDFNAYIFVTDDFGQTWRRLSSGIPEGSSVRVIREHHRNRNLLFAGTERGLYISWDRGENWRLVTGGLPIVPIADLQIHPRENDLIVGTHGRGAYLLDDITWMEQLTPEALRERFTLVQPRTAVDYRRANHRAHTSVSDLMFIAPNAPLGAILYFHLREAPAEDEELKLEILDAAGQRVLTEVTVNRPRAGLNRVTWNLGTGSGNQAARARPGTYTARLTVGEQSQSHRFEVEADPRLAGEG